MLRRLNIELNKAQKEGQALGLTVNVINNDTYRWEFTIDGPQGTPYQGRLIKGVVTFPAEYPYKAPNVVFILSDGMPDLLKLLFWSIQFI